jgi:hypothetical protein
VSQAWMRDALEGEVGPDVVPALTDPLDLHLIARYHNWDSDDDPVPGQLSEHPHLDKGTALLLFWQAEPPEVWIGMNGDPVDDHPLADLIDALRRRLVEDRFVRKTIAVDLRADLGYNRLFIERLRRAGVPPALWQPTPGEPFDESELEI